MNPPNRSNPASHQHFVPEFYLKRFASDVERLKLLTLRDALILIS
jgi:hypothetical protein